MGEKGRGSADAHCFSFSSPHFFSTLLQTCGISRPFLSWASSAMAVSGLERGRAERESARGGRDRKRFLTNHVIHFHPSASACYLLFGRTFLPGGAAWAVVILWLGAQVWYRAGERKGERESAWGTSLITSSSTSIQSHPHPTPLPPSTDRRRPHFLPRPPPFARPAPRGRRPSKHTGPLARPGPAHPLARQDQAWRARPDFPALRPGTGLAHLPPGGARRHPPPPHTRHRGGPDLRIRRPRRLWYALDAGPGAGVYPEGGRAGHHHPAHV